MINAAPPPPIQSTAIATQPVPDANLQAPRLRECHDCGLLQRLPPLPAHAVARCPRCGAVLRRRRSEPTLRPLALAAAGLLLLLIASQTPFLDLRIGGIERQTTLVTGPRELGSHGQFVLALVVLGTTLIAPALRLLGLIWVLAQLRRPHPPAYLNRVFRWAEQLKPWSMPEVFLLGVFVAYTKLVDLAHVAIGPALVAMAALMLVMAAIDTTLDPEAVWRRIDRHDHELVPAGRSGSGPPDTPPTACRVCDLVNAPGEPFCVRCGSQLHRRKPDSLERTWALMLAAVVLYLPANLFPVLTLINFGRGHPSTILGGAIELARAGMWPLALLVLFASVLVPVLKLLSLSVMLIATQRHSAWRLKGRTKLYRIVDFIGRWSMIDVFMISILTALVRMGRVASVYPGPGVLSFCGVVILTMLAAACFDPRRMWDAAATGTPGAP